MEFVETIALHATLLGLQYNYKAEFTRSHVTKFSPRTLSSTALFGGPLCLQDNLWGYMSQWLRLRSVLEVTYTHRAGPGPALCIYLKVLPQTYPDRVSSFT